MMKGWKEKTYWHRRHRLAHQLRLHHTATISDMSSLMDYTYMQKHIDAITNLTIKIDSFEKTIT